MPAPTNASSQLTFKKRVNPNSRELATSTNPYYTSKNPFPNYNGARGSYGNCTWYAYGRFMEIWGTAPDSEKAAHPWKNWTRYNNAYTFVAAAKESGYSTGLIPKPGAIICWAYYGNANGSPGHVAVVEAVNMDANKNIQSIEISQSGWSSGDLPNRLIYPGTGQLGTGGWSFGYNNSYFLGFVYNPITFAGSNGNVNGVTEESGTGIDFQTRASVLISSDNYSFISVEEDTVQPQEYSSVTSLQQSLQTLQSSMSTIINVASSAIQNVVSDVLTQALNQTIKQAPKIIKRQSLLSVAENVVEAPFIELELAGYTIGSYKGALDKYPNYISSLQVSKQNGLINQYIINLVHQIRPGEDSNLLDELLSTVNYNKIKIKYGDANTGIYFRDENAIITNVRMSRNYVGMNISYTLEATSEGQLIKTYVTNFPSVTDKPSNVLNKLIYGNGVVSTIIQEAFPGMTNQTFVQNNNLIPSNDAIVDLDAQRNVNILDYINYLVGNMSNSNSDEEVIRNSVFYITYIDNDSQNPYGAYFQIKEIKSELSPNSITDRIYDITVGYPQDIIYSFTVDNTQSWELLYKNMNKATEYMYTITNNGDIQKYYSPAISTSTNILNEINRNWWTQMVKFPVTAQLTIKGLLTPIMLMDYININVVFYGQTHILSGTYAITGQTDFLSGTGYKTTLSLIRVGQLYE